MTDKELQQMKREILDEFHKAVITARDSTPPSLSKVIMELIEKVDKNDDRLKRHIDEHRIDNENIASSLTAIKAEVTPLTTNFNESKGFWTRFFFLAKVGGSLTAIGYALFYLIQLSRKI